MQIWSPRSWVVLELFRDFFYRFPFVANMAQAGKSRVFIWSVPANVPKNGWCIRENPIKMDNLGVPSFQETAIYIVSSYIVVYFPLIFPYPICIISMDCFKGTSTNHGFSHEIWGVPINFPLNQSFDISNFLLNHHFPMVFLCFPLGTAPWFNI